MKANKMNPHTSDLVWLDARETVGVAELARVSGLSEAELCELQDYGALTPVQGSNAAVLYSAHWVTPLRTAARLRSDFELDLFVVALLLDHLGRIAALEEELRTLRAHLPNALQT